MKNIYKKLSLKLHEKSDVSYWFYSGNQKLVFPNAPLTPDSISALTVLKCLP